MSDIIEIPNTENTNEWIEIAIKNEYLKYYDYKNFSNIEEIGSGGFGKCTVVNRVSSSSR